MRNISTISPLLPFQGVNGFTNDNPTQGAASLALGAPLGFQPAQNTALLALAMCLLCFCFAYPGVDSHIQM